MISRKGLNNRPLEKCIFENHVFRLTEF